MSRRRSHRHERHSHGYGYVILAAGIMMIIAWGFGLFRFAGAMPETAPDTSPRTDAIVVLTGGSGRLDEGLDLLLADQADVLFISGVYVGLDIRNLLQTFLAGGDFIEDRVEIGNATDTIGNAEETATWMRDKGYSSMRLVTAAYHMPRSMLEFEFALPGATIIPHPVFPEHVKADWWRWPGSAGLVIKEYNKFLLAWTRHRAMALRGVFPSDG